MSEKGLIIEAKEAVMSYNVSKSIEVANKAIDEGINVVKLIQEGFSAGIISVGDLYEQKKVFLPHVMAAANAMNAAVEVLNPVLEKQGGKLDGGLGKFVICTIEGDIHSIGKDIVAIMLKIAGFDVMNIGRDVPIVDIVETCKVHKPVAVGTSALMTSTMAGQKTFEKLLREEGIRDDLLTNVGGAPVTQEWADEIGADIYSENSTDAVAKMTAAVEKN